MDCTLWQRNREKIGPDAAVVWRIGMLNMKESRKKRVATVIVVIILLIAMVGVPVISAMISVL